MTETVIDTKKEIDNRYVWALTFVNVAWFICDLLSVNWQISTFGAFFINSSLMVADAAKLKDSGYKKPLVVLGIILLPIYIIQRAYILRGVNKPYYAISWVVTFVLFTYYSGNMDYNKQLEVSACNIVTQIIKENYSASEIECQAVKIDEKVKDGFYRAHAIVSNGNSINIGIEERENDQIYVTLSSF